MAGRSLWHHGRAVAGYDVVPATIRYQTYLPVLYLRDAGFDVHLVCRGAAREQREIDGVRCWIEPGIPGVLRRVAQLRGEFFYAEASTYGALLGPAGRRSWIRNPRIATRPAVARLQRLALRSFDAVSFTNPALQRDWHLRPEQLTELPYPVHIDFWREPWPKETGFWDTRGLAPPTGPVLVYVGNLTRGKRQLELVGALAPLLRERRDAVLVLVGEAVEPGVQEAITAARAREDVAAQVLLTGRLGHWQIRELMQWAAMSVIHTAFETQCMALYESLAAGVPAVITAIPELTSQFPHLLAHADDAELRANVERLIADPDLGRRQVDQSADRLATVDWRRHDEQFYGTLERLLGRPVR